MKSAIVISSQINHIKFIKKILSIWHISLIFQMQNKKVKVFSLEIKKLKLLLMRITSLFLVTYIMNMLYLVFSPMSYVWYKCNKRENDALVIYLNLLFFRQICTLI